MNYYFEIKTGDQCYAGTDSNIFVQLYGAKGISEEVRLNGHISGNAFERNQLDKFKINFSRDFGDIYRISIRSDMMYAGAGWLCNYIVIQRENATPVKFQLPANTWFEDKNIKYFNATSGYNSSLSSRTEIYSEILGAKHTIPAGATLDKTVKSTVAIEVNENKVEVYDTSTKASVGVETSAIKSTFEFQLNTSLSTDLNGKLNKTDEFSTNVHIEKSDKERILQEVWTEQAYDYEAALNDVTYKFSIPVSRSFVGFKEVE